MIKSLQSLKNNIVITLKICWKEKKKKIEKNSIFYSSFSIKDYSWHYIFSGRSFEF